MMGEEEREKNWGRGKKNEWRGQEGTNEWGTEVKVEERGRGEKMARRMGEVKER